MPRLIDPKLSAPLDQRAEEEEDADQIRAATSVH